MTGSFIASIDWFFVDHPSVPEAMSSDEDEDQDRLGPVSRTAHEYAAGTTVHGITYIFEEGRLILERVIWLIVVALAVTFALVLSISAYHNWQDNPVLTTIRTTGHPIEEVDFPSITICAQGAANEIIDAALFKQFFDYLQGKDLEYDEMNADEIKREGVSFLMEKYPGATKAPNELVRFMTSPDVDKSMQSLAVLNPEDQTPDSCGTNRRKRSSECPSSEWIYNLHGVCVLISEQVMTKGEGDSFCSFKHRDATQYKFIDSIEFVALYRILEGS